MNVIMKDYDGRFRRIKNIFRRILLYFRSSADFLSWMHAYEQIRHGSCMHRNSTRIDVNTLYIHPRTIVCR